MKWLGHDRLRLHVSLVVWGTLIKAYWWSMVLFGVYSFVFLMFGFST